MKGLFLMDLVDLEIKGSSVGILWLGKGILWNFVSREPANMADEGLMDFLWECSRH